MINMEDLENKLVQLNSYKAIRGVLKNETLKDLQCVDILKALYRKRSIIVYSTGMGKTFIASAIIKMLLNEDPDKKFLILIKNTQLEQTPAKMFSLLGLQYVVSTGEAESVRNTLENGRFKSVPITFLTHSCLESEKALKVLVKEKHFFDALIIDEAHCLNNFTASNSGSVLAGLSKCYEYVIALTATPIRSNIGQFSKLAHIIDPVNYPDIKKLSRALSSGRFDFSSDPCFVINRNRAEFGTVEKLLAIPVMIQPMPEQRFAVGTDLFKVCKGDGAIRQAETLVNVILERINHGEKGLVYVNMHAIREWIEPFLSNAGIKYACINGRIHDRSERARILQEFNEENAYDVIITSITESLDLDCEYVIFYEFTLDVDQMIGRAYRGFDDKELKVYFLITEDSGEVDYFYNNILPRSMLIQKILGKGNSAVLSIGEYLGKRGY